MAGKRPAVGSAILAEPSTMTSLRQRNRARVLAHIVLAGETTRASIASEAGLSVASVTNLVTELVAEGLVVERGSIASGGGRPIGIIAPQPGGAAFVGADVGERGVAVELFDLGMNRVDREFRGGSSAESPAAIATDLSEAVAALRARNPAVWPRVTGIGLGLPGVVERDPRLGQVLYAQSLGWSPVPIAELLDVDRPVIAENGAKTLAKAEQWFGSARGIDHALVVLLGRGVGLGVIVDGRLQHGAHSSAAEWGHVKIERGGRLCRCGGRGCVEAYLGADAILASWAAVGGRFEGGGWRAIGELLDAAAAGTSSARSVVDDVIDTLGTALGGLVNLTNPERVVIGGWVGLRLMESLAGRLGAAIRANSLARPGGQFDLQPATFGGDSVALGAAIMPLEALIRTPRET